MSQKEEECSSKGNPMKRLEDAIFEVASSGQSEPLSMVTISRIKACLANEIFRSHKFHITLDHPPYAEMIYKAIEELNKSGDYSNEAALSAYIKSEHHDDDNLPWAHESLLSHHLRWLNQKGEIIVMEDGCYTFPKLKHSHNKDFHQILQQNKALLLLNNKDDDDGASAAEAEVEALSIKPVE